MPVNAQNLLESALCRSNHTLFLRCDPDGQVIACSHAMSSVLGRELPQLVGANFFDLVSVEEASRIQKTIGPPDFEASLHRLQLPDREGLLFQLVADAQGFLLLGESLDRQALETASTRRLTQEAKRLKDVFVTNLNHEIRDPLNAVAGMSHLLELTPLNEQQCQYLESIRTGVEGLLRVVDRVLEFTSSDLEEPRLQVREFQLDALTQALLGQLGARAQEKGVELLVRIDPDVPTRIQGDPIYLNQLLSGLLENGVKFSAGGRVSLSVHLLEKDDRKIGLEFKVLDSGIGMTGEQLASLADPFSALQNERLGLRRCQRLAEMMQANLTIDSQAGQGTLVTVRLFFGHGRSQSAEPQRTGGPGSRVLLVEDNALNQRIVCELLEKSGVSVDVASNGREALEKIRECSGESRWRLVLMDLEMPELDGIATARQIRENRKFDQVPIIATTSHVLAEQRRRCQEAGMDAFLSKPIDPDSWFKRLRQWLPLESTSAGADFPLLSAVNSQLGLKICGGNPSFYRSLLLDFAERCQRTARELELASSHGDLPGIQFCVHSLHGLAANLGAEHLARACQNIEQLVRVDDRDRALAALPSLVRDLLASSTSLVQELAQNGPSRSIPEGWTGENLQETLVAIERLKRHLEAGMGDSLDSVQELIGCSPLLAGQLDRLEKLVNQFDFAAALHELEAIQGRIS